MTIHWQLFWNKYARRRGTNLFPKRGVMYVITRDGKISKISEYKGIIFYTSAVTLTNF